MNNLKNDLGPEANGAQIAMLLSIQTLVHSLFGDLQREALAIAHRARIDKLAYRDDSDPEASAKMRTAAHNTITRIYEGNN